MQNFYTWFKKHSTLLKLVFVITVSIIVFGQLLSIVHAISLSQMITIFRDIPFWKLLCMFLIGLIAVVPMTGYDFMLNKMLKFDKPKKYLFETSWIVNTINNLAGFGGVISIGLRSEFYAKKTDDRKKVIGAFAKIVLFTLSGLSIYSFFAFLLIHCTNIAPYLKQYWVWLVGGALYFPTVYFITSRKKSRLLGGLTRNERLSLIGTSFLEWTGLIVIFISIGYLLGVNIPLWEVIPLLIAAVVIGIASMIPGALGSFDVMMILGLANLGIDKETVVLWLLLYRIFYYLIPFFIGLSLFSKHLFKRFDQQYKGIPKQLSLEVFHKIEVGLLYFSGIMIVLLATVPQAFTEFRWLQQMNPFRFQVIMQFPSLLLGYSFLIMGRGIAARVQRAYWPTIALIVITIVYSFTIGTTFITPFFFLCLLGVVKASKSELFRKQLVYSWEARTLDGIIFTSLTMVYLIMGVLHLPTYHHPTPAPFKEFMFFPSEKLWFSSAIVIFVIISLILLLLRYLAGDRKQVGGKLDDRTIARIQQILTTFGGNSDSELVFLNDKSVYIYTKDNEDRVFFQFSTWNNKCVVMGNPSGNCEDFVEAIDDFIHEADMWGYQLVFYEVNEQLVMPLHDFGFDFIKMGEEALVDLTTFTTAGKKMKGTRAVINKITKEGYTFDVLQPPFSLEQMETFQSISDSWLGARKEKGFSMGFFEPTYLARNPIAVVRNQTGEIVSFANLIPSYTNEIGTIDLMRHHQDKAPSGSMDFLFIHLFEYMQEQGIHYFNLGMAPLSNVGTSRKSFVQERIASLVYEFGSHFYSFQGLRDYKEKYASQWRPRYTLYSRDSSLIYVMLAILFIDNTTVETVSLKSLWKKIANQQD